MIKRNPRKIKRNQRQIYRAVNYDDLIQLTGPTAKALKKKLYIQSGGKCPVLGYPVNVRDTVLDHRHKLKHQKLGINGRGLVRGAIHFQVNAFEGIMLKKYKRYGLTEMIPLPELLRNLADYLENPPCPQIYIYPSEKPKAKTFGKLDYNRIVKYYKVMFPRSRVIPPYPKSGIKKVGKSKKGQKQKYKYVAKLSPKWQKLLDEANRLHGRKK